MNVKNAVAPGTLFNRLTVIKELGGPRRYIECRCECGTVKSVRLDKLRSGLTKSCGCLRREKSTKHGEEGTPLYLVWAGIKRRCNNPNHRDYPNYGGRGITLSPAWSCFRQFKQDMGDSYKKGLQIDRIDNEGPYNLQNCRWVPPKQNSRNRRVNRWVNYKGESKCLAEWAELTGLNYNTLKWRIDNGWPIEKALTKI